MRRLIIILTIVLLNINIGYSEEENSLENCKVVKYKSQIIKELVDKIKVDILIEDNLGQKAKEACDIAYDLKRYDIILLGLRNMNYDVKKYCLEIIKNLEKNEKVNIIIKALKDPELFKVQKVGELRVVQKRFEEDFILLLSSVLKKNLEKINLSSIDERETIIQQLKNNL